MKVEIGFENVEMDNRIELIFFAPDCGNCNKFGKCPLTNNEIMLYKVLLSRVTYVIVKYNPRLIMLPNLKVRTTSIIAASNCLEEIPQYFIRRFSNEIVFKLFSTRGLIRPKKKVIEVSIPPDSFLHPMCLIFKDFIRDEPIALYRVNLSNLAKKANVVAKKILTMGSIEQFVTIPLMDLAEYVVCDVLEDEDMSAILNYERCQL